MKEEQRNEFLKDEYLKLQDQYEDYDRRALMIKGLVSAGAIAAVAIGLDPAKSAGGLLWIVICLFAACFWYLEARWKLFQYALQDRIKHIEAYFRDENENDDYSIPPLQMFSSWGRAYSSIRQPEQKYRTALKNAGLQKFVKQPYMLIIVVSVFGFVRDVSVRYWTELTNFAFSLFG